MFEPIIREIEAYSRIIIHRHANPDGDALGSQIGLKHLLQSTYPAKEVLVVGDPAGRYRFMDDSAMDEVSDQAYSGALAIILDTSSRALISDARYSLAARTARIDHHIFCEKIADTEVTDTSFESASGMVAAMALECGLSVSPLAAKSLFTGMVTDSGRFFYDSTSSRTFALASFLMRQQFDLTDIYQNLYADDFHMVTLRALFVLKIRFTEHHVAYIYTTLDEYKALDTDTFTISRGMVGTMGNIRNVDIWVNFTETDKGVLCELRSSKHNINPVAVKFGGGGHAKASGATVKNHDEAMRMLDELDRMMEAQQ